MQTRCNLSSCGFLLVEEPNEAHGAERRALEVHHQRVHAAELLGHDLQHGAVLRMLQPIHKTCFLTFKAVFFAAKWMFFVL